METLASYPDAWADLRRRRSAYLIVGFGGVFAVMVVVGLLSLVSPPLAGMAFLLGALAYIIGFSTVAFRLHTFRCPRCEHGYSTAFSGFPIGPIVQDACAHCSLRADM